MEHLILIKNDLFNIAKRIRKINKKLFVFYNKKNNNFEIYSTNGCSFSFEVSLGKTLNQKAIKIVFTSQASNIEGIVKNLDLQNEKIEAANLKKQNMLAKDMLSDCLNFASKKAEDVDFSKLNIGGKNDS